MTKCIFVLYSPHIADAELYIDDGTDQLYYYRLSRARFSALISILLFDFIVPFLVVSKENLPTT